MNMYIVSFVGYQTLTEIVCAGSDSLFGLVCVLEKAKIPFKVSDRVHVCEADHDFGWVHFEYWKGKDYIFE